MDITISMNDGEIAADAWFALIDHDSTLVEKDVLTCINPRTGKTMRTGKLVGFAFYQPEGEEICGAFAYHRGAIVCENANARTLAKAKDIAAKLNAALSISEA